jgi:hypothetical protein
MTERGDREARKSLCPAVKLRQRTIGRATNYALPQRRGRPPRGPGPQCPQMYSTVVQLPLTLEGVGSSHASRDGCLFATRFSFAPVLRTTPFADLLVFFDEDLDFLRLALFMDSSVPLASFSLAHSTFRGQGFVSSMGIAHSCSHPAVTLSRDAVTTAGSPLQPDLDNPSWDLHLGASLSLRRGSMRPAKSLLFLHRGAEARD